jgi:hypothetical protein
MGRKQGKSWQYILLFPAACLIVLNGTAGCRPSLERPGLSQCQERADQLPAGDVEIDRLRHTIQVQAETINKLREQLKQLKAVDLEPVQPEKPTSKDAK